MKINYYILVHATGKSIPVKTKIEISSLFIANCFYSDVIKIIPTNFVNYVIAGGQL